MGYVTKNLMENEEVRYQTKTHKIIFLRSFIYLILAFLINALPCGEEAGLDCETKNMIYIAFMAIFILSFVYSLIQYIFSEFAVTSKRVIVKKGFIRRETWELLLTKVESVQVDQGIIGRILGWGTITISGTGGASDPVKLIRKPLEFRMKAQEEIEKGEEDKKDEPKLETKDEETSEKKLLKLKDLLEKELISEEEYNQKREEVLNAI